MGIKLLPYILLLSVATSVGGFWFGYDYRDAKVDGEVREALSLAIEEFDKIREEDQQIIKDSIEIETRIETKYETIIKEVEKVVTPECTSLSDDWVRVFNSSIEAANKATEADKLYD
jgi:hypothetical protein